MPCASRTINKKPETVNKGFKFGFSLIELLIVVSLFGIAASLITASYLGFERNQRVKSAASQLKNDLRLIQNNALSGGKGLSGACASSSNLGGWYVSIEQGKNSYTVGGDCLVPLTGEVSFGAKSVNLPLDIKVNRIFHGTNPDVTYPVAILFRSLATGVTFHDGRLAASGPLDFFDDVTGLPKNFIAASPPQNPVVIELSSLDGARKYQVKIELSGEINEVKP